MFGLSVWEIFTLFVVTLLVVGPERMPGLARSAGEWVVKIRRFVASAKAEIDRELNTVELKKLLSSQEQELDNLRKLIEETKRDVEESGRHLLEAVDDVKNEAIGSGSELANQLVDAPDRQPSASSDKKEKPAASSDRPSAKQDAQPEAHTSVDSKDNVEPPRRGADETFAGPFSSPEPKPAPESKSRQSQPEEHNEPKERRD